MQVVIRWKWPCYVEGSVDHTQRGGGLIFSRIERRRRGSGAQLCMSRQYKWVAKGLWFLSRTFFPHFSLPRFLSLFIQSFILHPHLPKDGANSCSSDGGLIGADSTAVHEHMAHSHKRAEKGCKGSFEPIPSGFTDWAGWCKGNPTCTYANYQPCG